MASSGTGQQINQSTENHLQGFRTETHIPKLKHGLKCKD